jgi:dihydrofolate reductase
MTSCIECPLNNEDTSSPPLPRDSMDIVLLAAISANGVIGRGNRLPWRLRSDLQHFRALTMGKPILMGRKTFLSIGKPLPGRTTIVASRDQSFAAPGIVVAPDLTTALAVARGDALRRGVAEIFVVGGTEIYVQAMAAATCLAITEVHKTVEGDARFPPVDRNAWREIARDEHEPGVGDDAAFAFVTYRRVAAS